MNCPTCGAWTSVAETRKADNGYTLKRTRLCANGHRFPTFEVLQPIYARSPATVRKTRVAAAVRAFQWARDSEVARRWAAGGTNRQGLADAMGMTVAALKKALERVKRRGK